MILEILMDNNRLDLGERMRKKFLSTIQGSEWLYAPKSVFKPLTSPVKHQSTCLKNTIQIERQCRFNSTFEKSTIQNMPSLNFSYKDYIKESNPI